MTIFDAATLSERQRRAAARLDEVLKPGEAVRVECGVPLTKPGGWDQTYPFLPHPDYFWLTGSRRSHGVSVYAKGAGWTHFVRPVTREEKVWEGGDEQVMQGQDVANLETWLSQQKFSKLHRLGGPAQTSFDEVQEAYNRARRPKDAAEVALVRKLGGIANHGYRRLQECVRAGMTERDVQLEYETAVLRAGSERMPYESIVGAGTNAAILHAIPTARVVQKGDLVLVDAGADIEDYCVDITRVFFADGKPDERQKAVYDTVARAQAASIALCKPGIEWHNVHRASARVIGQGLKDMGVLKGDLDDLLESGAVSLFFPHGVGHMVGLRVRDVGGKFVTEPKRCYGVRVRVDLPLEENFLMTVEPGLYFIRALLEDAETRQKHRDHVNWDELPKWLNLGGVRLEDDVLVTKSGPDNLTSMVAK